MLIGENTCVAVWKVLLDQILNVLRAMGGSDVKRNMTRLTTNQANHGRPHTTIIILIEIDETLNEYLIYLYDFVAAEFDGVRLVKGLAAKTNRPEQTTDSVLMKRPLGTYLVHAEVVVECTQHARYIDEFKLAVCGEAATAKTVAAVAMVAPQTNPIGVSRIRAMMEESATRSARSVEW